MDWQPIETAPLSEKARLLVTDGSVVFVAMMHTNGAISEATAGGFARDVCGDPVFLDLERSPLSHWMPLPEPPQAERTGA